jgi:hypothetical protein
MVEEAKPMEPTLIADTIPIPVMTSPQNASGVRPVVRFRFYLTAIRQVSCRYSDRAALAEIRYRANPHDCSAVRRLNLIRAGKKRRPHPAMSK